VVAGALAIDIRAWYSGYVNVTVRYIELCKLGRERFLQQAAPAVLLYNASGVGTSQSLETTDHEAGAGFPDPVPSSGPQLNLGLFPLEKKRGADQYQRLGTDGAFHPAPDDLDGKRVFLPQGVKPLRNGPPGHPGVTFNAKHILRFSQFTGGLFILFEQAPELIVRKVAVRGKAERPKRIIGAGLGRRVREPCPGTGH